ncbi:hypothetical protein FOA43_000324 [Brettanomyces nanus]|uniref:Sorting nexin-4 n=1 Tax=Eeniella nana TaxID=13502 RepID=A0A875RN02_EENNA|nr:uncharacterized protein FOA43_000324 [Brettanomyces nanus]QPG73020.1 hypothetical protein FOA43_000324 [Brettanomyces nanus]
MADQFTSVSWDKEESKANVGEVDINAEDSPKVVIDSSSEPPPLESLKEENDQTIEDKEDQDGPDNESGLITSKMVLAANAENNAPEGDKALDVEADVKNVNETGNSSESKAELQSDYAPDNVSGSSQAGAFSSLASSAPSYQIETIVGEPLTEHDSSNAFVSYRIIVKTQDPAFPQKEFQTRRRYSDFFFLYQCLMNDYPTLLIPPLPNKQRLEYIKGGRFSDEFTTKRSISLSNFLYRVCYHPILQKSDVLHIFLADTDHWNTYKSNLKIPPASGLDTTNSASQNLETVTEFIMNSFKKPIVEPHDKKEFQDIQDKVSRLQENLSKIDSIYGKVLHRQHNIADDISKFGDEFSKLTLLLSNDLDGSHSEPEDLDGNTKRLVKQFSDFSGNLSEVSENIYHLDHRIEYNYLTALKDLEHYILQLKNLLKLKDAKALDFDMLSNYLDKAKQEKEHLMNGGSITVTTEGTLSFLTRKLESVTGLGSRQAGNLTNERIDKLDERIDMLAKEKEKAKKIYFQYERDILTEYEYFNKIKNREIASSLEQLGKYYLSFYSKATEELKKLDINVASEAFTFDNKLTQDGKLFSGNQVQKNGEIIADDIQKIDNMTNGN